MVKIIKVLDAYPDYDAGLLLLSRLSKNRALVLSLSKKKNPEKLEYELRKIAGAKGIVVPALKTAIQKTNIPSAKGDTIPYPDPSRLKIIHKSKQIALEDLPKDMQGLWLVNRDSYKIIRSLHEKLKLMSSASDNDRHPLVSRIVELDALIRENWAVIDSWEPGTSNVSPVEEKLPIPPVMDFRRVNANRKYISTGIKKILDGRIKNDKLSALKQSVLARFSELRNAGIEMTQDSIDELKKAGINI